MNFKEEKPRNNKSGPVSINGKRYESFSEAARKTGLTHAVVKRCSNKLFESLRSEMDFEIRALTHFTFKKE